MTQFEPSPKSDAVEEFITKIMGKDRRAVIMSGDCMTCDRKASTMGFRTLTSVREYKISGMCQRCQDSVFGINEDEE